jgi:6-phosphogluconate dehydrogenase
MDIAMIGLGRMGANMARRLARGGMRVLGQDVTPAAREALTDEANVQTAESLDALIQKFPGPRIFWLMLPAGPVTQATIDRLASAASAGDIIVDGGNAFYKDSQKRAQALAQRGIDFIDCGVSGGVWGLENGYTLTLGGKAEAMKKLERFARILAPENGWLHCGPSGAGHFVKMVHNGIEYGAMQAYAEGFALLAAKEDLHLDVAAIAETWRHGSVIRSWLLDLTAEMLNTKPDLNAIPPVVNDSGEGRWTALEAVELGVPAPVMSLALMMRFATQGKNDYPARLLALMRNAFGGHTLGKDKH